MCTIDDVSDEDFIAVLLKITAKGVNNPLVW